MNNVPSATPVTPKFDWTTAFKIVIALAVTGFAWTQSNQFALITLASMVIVWLIQFAGKQWNFTLGKTWLTVILLTVSIGLSVIFQPVTLPAFPAYNGDAISYISALLVFASALLALGSKVFALATGLYNILLADVLAGLSNTLSASLLPIKK